MTTITLANGTLDGNSYTEFGGRYLIAISGVTIYGMKKYLFSSPQYLIIQHTLHYCPHNIGLFEA